MTAELYRGRSKTSSFQLEGEMVSGFNAGSRIGTGKRASSDRPICWREAVSGLICFSSAYIFNCATEIALPGMSPGGRS